MALLSGTSVAIFVVVTLLAYLFRVYLQNRRLVSKIPGPDGWPILGILFELMGPVEDSLPIFSEYARQYGPVMKYNLGGIFRVAVTGPEELEVLLNCKENITKGSFYNFLEPWLGTGLLTGAGHKWHSRRKLINPAFNYKMLEDSVQVFNANSLILVKQLQDTDEKYVKIHEYIAHCALDIICESAMGTSVNAQTGGSGEYVNAVKRMRQIYFQRVITPWMSPDLVFRFTPLGREQKAVVTVLQDFCTKVIEKQKTELQRRKLNQSSTFKDKPRRKSFLDLLLEMSDKDDSWTVDDIREEVNTFMFGGHDTTSTAISWALFLLAAHPEVQDKVVSELSDIFGSDPRQPTMADLTNMTYLEQVIKESLRLYPSVPSFGRFITKDIQLGKYVVHSGVNVIISPVIVHHNPNLYPDPERFEPDRFSPEQSAGRHPYAYIPFSAGPRNCIVYAENIDGWANSWLPLKLTIQKPPPPRVISVIQTRQVPKAPKAGLNKNNTEGGQKFARLEEKSVISTLLRHFKMETLMKLEDVKVIRDAVLIPKEPIRIKFEKRR